MNNDILIEKIEYLSSLPHSSLVEHCIYLENENDNYKAQKYITDFISENGIICEKNKEIERLNEELGDANYTITQLHKVMDRHYVKKEDYDRLNNIIDELENYLKENSKQSEIFECDRYYKSILDKLKALKEGKK